MPDIVLEQRADIKQIFAVPFLRDLARNSADGGIHIHMVGPIVVNNHSVSSPESELEPIKILSSPAHEGPLLLRGVSSVDVPEKTMKQFSKIYDGLPNPKLDATVRLVVETSFKKKGTAKGVAECLDCSVYKARSLMEKYGLSS